eukprot:TRINITY_DN6824_c0_g1_i1.p1 TRINITY_DN6824_c0_g1~~TRINITY_DN6824_c0_g1_i1.p1  ORF type:complete len:468 (+),score=153.02 TRINITY_DN6824_c0_g1_i1:162-1565(+)
MKRKERGTDGEDSGGSEGEKACINPRKRRISIEKMTDASKSLDVFRDFSGFFTRKVLNYLIFDPFESKKVEKEEKMVKKVESETRKTWKSLWNQWQILRQVSKEWKSIADSLILDIHPSVPVILFALRAKLNRNLIQRLMSFRGNNPLQDGNRLLSHVLSFVDNEDILILLLSDPRVDPSLNHSESFIQCCHMGWQNAVRIMLQDRRIDPSARNNSAIVNASSIGNIQIVNMLVDDRRVNPGDQNNGALRMAAANGHTKLVSLLLKCEGVDPSNPDITKEAAANGHEDVVYLLITDGRADPSANQNIALRSACANGHLQTVSTLLRDPRTDPADFNGDAIRKAASNGHTEILAILLMDFRSKPLDSLILASEGNHLKSVKMLLSDPQCDPMMENNKAIKRAIRKGNKGIVKLLLQDRRMDPTINDNMIIKYAISHGQHRIVQMLVRDQRVANSLKNYAIGDLQQSTQ